MTTRQLFQEGYISIWYWVRDDIITNPGMGKYRGAITTCQAQMVMAGSILVLKNAFLNHQILLTDELFERYGTEVYSEKEAVEKREIFLRLYAEGVHNHLQLVV